MIPSDSKPSIRQFLLELGYHPTRNRCNGPCHEGDNPDAFSFDDDKGLWFCHRCAIGGDVFTLVMTVMDTDFAGALRHFGLEPGRPPTPDPDFIRQREAEAQQWNKLLQQQRELREEFRIRSLIEYHGRERLRSDSEDRAGWDLLKTAYSGRPLSAIEYELDRLLEQIPREAYQRAA